MEFEGSSGVYEGSNLDNGFENVSAPLSDELHDTSFQPTSERNLYDSGLVNSCPEPLIEFSGVEEVPKGSESTWIGSHTPAAAVASSNDPSPTPNEFNSIKTEEKKPSSSAQCEGCCSFVKNIDPRVLDLIYWRDIKKSGVVFGSTLVLLLSLALFSVLSVVSYLSLVTLTITLSFRLYKNVMSAVQKTGEGHPYKQYLDMDLSVSETKVHQSADAVMKHVLGIVTELRRLFLIEDMVDSLKFGLFLWIITYIGAWFNGMTLVILAVVAIFSLPKVYDTYKIKIDEYVGKARTKIQEIWKNCRLESGQRRLSFNLAATTRGWSSKGEILLRVQEKIPLPGKKKVE